MANLFSNYQQFICCNTFNKLISLFKLVWLARLYLLGLIYDALFLDPPIVKLQVENGAQYEQRLKMEYKYYKNYICYVELNESFN